MNPAAPVELTEDQQRQLFLASRERNPPNHAIAFVENQVSIPGQPDPIFSERSNSFVPLEQAHTDREHSKELWKQVNEEKESLFQLMEQVQKKLRGQEGDEVDNSASTVNLRQCSWQQVMNEIDKTAWKWKGRPHKQGKAMVFIDKVGKHSAALESWLGLLPMGDYGSSICGVFQLAIGAAGQYSKVEDTVLEALAEIPKVLESARRYVEIYRQMRGHFLEQRTFELFRAIISVLRQIMQFFADGKSHKVFGVLAKQGAYKEDLLKGVDEIKAGAQAVNEEAAQCNSRLNISMFNTVEKISQEQGLSTSLLQQILGLMLTHPRCAHDSGVAAVAKETSRLQLSGFDMVNVDYTAVSDDEAMETSHRTVEIHAQNTNDQNEARALTARFFKLLHYDEDIVPEDVAFSKVLGERLGSDAPTRAARMIDTDEFQDFIKGNARCLLVNGREDIARAEGISPLSWVVAIMMEVPQSLARIKIPMDVLVLVHFCARHKPPPFGNIEDPKNSSARTMLASLVCQLISQLETRGISMKLPSLTDSHWKKAKKMKPRILKKIFRSLIEQIPKGTRVICMIDDITWYEKQMLKDETCEIIDELIELAREGESDDEGHEGDDEIRFSLLVTSQNFALYVKKLFPEDCVVDLKESYDEDDAARSKVAHMATGRLS